MLGSCPYLLVLGAAGAAGAAFVSAGFDVSVPDWLHPANTPTRPNSTIRVYNLFIGSRKLHQILKKDKAKFTYPCHYFILYINSDKSVVPWYWGRFAEERHTGVQPCCAQAGS